MLFHELVEYKLCPNLHRKNIQLTGYFFFFFIVWLFMFCKSPIECRAATINAKSTSYSDVDSAINSASSGDTVIVPAGSSIWSSNLVITKGISLIGAGIGKTNIKNNGTTDFIITCNPSELGFRLSGFTFDANGARILKLGVSNKSAPFTENEVRVDHNKFTDSSGSGVSAGAIWNFGTLYGVVDNNTFERFYYPIKNDPGVGLDLWWSNSPQNNFASGSYRYLYYEDNIFTGPIEIITDGQFSARYVYRYNTITSSGVSSGLVQVFDIHGQQGNVYPQMASCFGAELYGNNITSSDNNMIGLVYQRSGQTKVFYNNIVTSGPAFNKAYTSSVCVCPSAYASLKLTHDSYWWNSRIGLTGKLIDSLATGGLACNGLTDIPKLGRDVISESSTPGITCGKLANRPATCIKGQGYWATDQSCTNLTGMVGANPTTPISGTLYKCTATNAWSAFYTPFTYPHPLRSESTATATSTQPSPPTNLTLMQ